MDGNCLEVSWKECLEIVLESLGLELVLHKFKPFTSHGKYVWWDARALSPCGAEVTVVLRNSALPFKEYPDVRSGIQYLMHMDLQRKKHATTISSSSQEMIWCSPAEKILLFQDLRERPSSRFLA